MMKRLNLGVVVMAAALLATSGGVQASAAQVARGQVVDLRTENKTNPIGIDESVPLLSWKSQGGTGQSAYEIRAAESLRALKRGDRVADTGKVSSTQSSNVPFTALPLRSRTTVAWQVRTWDSADRVSSWSQPATWDMGLLTNADWSAKWIENPTYDYLQPDGKESPLPVFGTSFKVDKDVASARLSMTGLGMYAANINGAAVSDAVLEPGQTTYAEEVDYRTYDLTGTLRRGTNVLGVETGSGAYQRVATPGRYFFGGRLEQHVTYGEPKVIAQLDITYADGTTQRVASDESWRTALGPTTFSSWWSGEESDGRRKATAPDSPRKINGADWQNATVVALSGTTTPKDTTPLRADPRPPVTVTETVEPVSISGIGNGSYVLDFGANRSGWPQVRVRGNAGTTITMTPSELLNPDGTLDVRSTGVNPTRGAIAYRYTLAGQGPETWHPKFTYNGFRYLQVDGLPSKPSRKTVTMSVIRASNPVASTFGSSSQVLNDIHAMTVRSIDSNMMSVLTDCPDREKGPYTGDNVHNIDALLTDYDMSAYQPQLIRNMATAQRKPGDESPGLIANIAPEFHRVLPVKLNYPQGVIEFLDEVNWGGAVIRVPWKLYQTYGDTRTMSLYYDNMVAWLDYEAKNRADNNGAIPGLGDWSANDNTTPMQLAIYAGYHSTADEMSKIAGVLGKQADQVKYAALAQELADSFNSQFRHTDATGVFYGSDSEASNAMALDAGLVAPADRAAVLERLVAAVRRADNHITTGSVALGPLFRALQAGGHDDVIYDMVVNPTSPGYGYLLASGHTTLSESLDGGGSQNHHFLGQVDNWFVSRVAGIRQAPDSIGYNKLIIAPAVVGDLQHAEGTYVTPYGTVKSSWKKDRAGRVTLKVSIPAGTTATIELPAAGSVTVRPQDNARSSNSGEADTDALATVDVGPGDHTFTSPS